jgi:hypothetical protein
MVQQCQHITPQSRSPRTIWEVRGLSKTALIYRNTAIIRHKRWHLLPPTDMIPPSAMEKQDHWMIASTIFVVEAKIVLRHEWHSVCLLESELLFSRHLCQSQWRILHKAAVFSEEKSFASFFPMRRATG